MNGPARGMGKRGSNRIHAWQPFMGETRGERKHVFSVRVLSRVLLRYLVPNYYFTCLFRKSDVVNRLSPRNYSDRK